MITYLQHRLAKMPLLKYVSIAFSGAFLTSAGNYAFNLIMARMLSAENLGIFQSFNSIFTILGVITTVIGFRIMNLTSEYSATNDALSIRTLFTFTTKAFLKLALVLALLMIIVSPLLKWFLHIDTYSPLILTALGIPSLILINNARGFLQGLLKFKQNSINLVAEVLMKIAIGVALVYVGVTYNAPILAMVGASSLAYLLVHRQVKNLIKLLKAHTAHTNERTEKKNEPSASKIETRGLQTTKRSSTPASWSGILQYTLPTFLAVGGITLFYTIDILLVRHYFGDTQPELVGMYATLSLLGKIIFFGSGSIAGTIFPVASKEHANGVFPLHLLKQGLTLTALLGTGITIAYFLFPEWIIRTLFGEQYLGIAALLGPFSIASTALSLMNVFTNFYLSTKKRLIILVPLPGILVFVFATIIRHHTIDEIVSNLLVSSLLSLIIYSVYAVFGHTIEKHLSETSKKNGALKSRA